MLNITRKTFVIVSSGLLAVCFAFFSDESCASIATYNVKDYGASGNKSDNCQGAIQKAIDICTESGGGTVYFPPGEYTSGTIFLRSNVRLYLEAGATLFASRDSKAYSRRALIYGDNVENTTIEGRGLIDGQAEFEWDDMRGIDPNFKDTMEELIAAGKRLLRTYPVRPTQHSVLLINCSNILIRDLRFERSSSWTISPWGCERLVIDGIYVSTSLTEGVWADGIDPDGCQDVRISNCTIETGDDCISLKASNKHGEPKPCENITISNCRLTSASTGLKIGDEIYADISHVTMNNCTIRSANRGIGIMIRGRGNVSDVIFSNLTMECNRYDWFWWGDADPFLFIVEESIYSRLETKYKKPLGTMKNILIANVIIHSKGSGIFYGHPDSYLENITLDNVRMEISTDTTKVQKAVNALSFQKASGIRIKDVEVRWAKPESKKWECALYLEDIQNLVLDNFSGRQAKEGTEHPAVALKQVKNAMLRGCRALPATSLFFLITGASTRDIHLYGNDFTQAAIPYRTGGEVDDSRIKAVSNLLPY